MVICIKCGKEQGRKSQSRCEYEGTEIEGDIAGPEHAWLDRGEFIDELREKLPPFVKERIAQRHKQYAEKQAEFSRSLMPYNKRRDEIKAAYDVYLSEGLSRDIKKKKQSAVRSLLRDVIVCTIGVLIGFIWIFPKSGLKITDIPFFMILLIIAVAVFFLGKRMVQFLKTIRKAESQEFAGELASKWRDKNGIDELESEIEELEDEWNYWNKNLKLTIRDAERALAGSDEELLKYYNMDKKAKEWYIKNIYEGAW